MKYKIHQEAEDPKDIIIEKTGHKIHFTMREVEAVQKQNQDARAGVEAKLKVEKAKIENIEHHHAFVKEMKEQELHTVHMYQEAKKIVQVAEAKLKEFDDNKKELAKELKAIEKQIPNLNGKQEESN